MAMSLIFMRIRNSFPFEWLYTSTHFETEACSNSEIGYEVGVIETVVVYVGRERNKKI